MTRAMSLLFFISCFFSLVSCLGRRVTIATIWKGSSRKQGSNLRRMVASLLHHSSNVSINMVFLSDPSSWPSAEAIIEENVAEHRARRVEAGLEAVELTMEYVGELGAPPRP